MISINIVLATYNGEKYIAEQLDSLLNQTYKNYLLYINDDCSTDSTPLIIEEYQKKYPDKIIFSRSEKGSGSAKYNFLSLIEKAINCDYMLFCDQDDVWHNEKIEYSLSMIRAAEDQYGKSTPILFNTDLIITNETLETIYQSFQETHNVNHYKTKLNKIISQNTVTGCTMIINKALLEVLDTQPEYCIMHDWWIELTAAAFGRILYSDKKTILYRQHTDNSVGVRNMKSLIFMSNFLFNSSTVIKDALYNSYKQANSFLRIYEDKLTIHQQEMIKEYISIEHSNKIKKIYMLIRHGFLKNGIARKIAHILAV
jgi:glycosyltransferase involved in cell wall biosynthesis